MAAVSGYKQIAEILITEGADVNVRDDPEGKYTPLLLATSNGSKELAEMLIANGADVNVRDDTEGKYTPLLLAAREECS